MGCSLAALEVEDLVQEIPERALAGESSGSDGHELKELMLRRFEDLELAQSPFQSLELDQEGLVFRGCLTILWVNFSQMGSIDSKEAILSGVQAAVRLGTYLVKLDGDLPNELYQQRGSHRRRIRTVLPSRLWSL